MHALLDADLTAAIRSLRVPELGIAHRRIRAGDENLLLPSERSAFARAMSKPRRQSGAARTAARQLLAGLGHARFAIIRSASGAPVWPRGIVGSLAHDATVAVAAVARRRHFACVGIDVEPAKSLPGHIVTRAFTTRELRHVGSSLDARVLFTAKEAAFKAVHSSLSVGWRDLEVDLGAGIARLPDGRCLEVKSVVSAHIVSLAFMQQPAAGFTR